MKKWMLFLTVIVSLQSWSANAFMLSDKQRGTPAKTHQFAGVNDTAMADFVFNWGERNYASYFSPANGMSINSGGYYYRYYANTGVYLAAKDGVLYVKLPGEEYVSVGPLSEWAKTAGYAPTPTPVVSSPVSQPSQQVPNTQPSSPSQTPQPSQPTGTGVTLEFLQGRWARNVCNVSNMSNITYNISFTGNQMFSDFGDGCPVTANITLNSSGTKILPTTGMSCGRPRDSEKNLFISQENENMRLTDGDSGLSCSFVRY